MKLNLLKLTGASAIALAAATLGASASFAASSQDRAILDAISFETQHKNLVIRVITTDGKRWDSIVDENIPFEARSVVDTAGNGVTHGIGVTLGACAGLSCQGAPIVMSEATLKRDIDRLLRIPIRRISQYDIDKNRKDVKGAEAAIKTCKRKLRQMKKTAIEYLQANDTPQDEFERQMATLDATTPFSQALPGGLGTLTTSLIAGLGIGWFRSRG